MVLPTEVNYNHTLLNAITILCKQKIVVKLIAELFSGFKFPYKLPNFALNSSSSSLPEFFLRIV